MAPGCRAGGRAARGRSSSSRPCPSRATRSCSRRPLDLVAQTGHPRPLLDVGHASRPEHRQVPHDQGAGAGGARYGEAEPGVGVQERRVAGHAPGRPLDGHLHEAADGRAGRSPAPRRRLRGGARVGSGAARLPSAVRRRTAGHAAASSASSKPGARRRSVASAQRVRRRLRGRGAARGSRRHCAPDAGWRAWSVPLTRTFRSSRRASCSRRGSPAGASRGRRRRPASPVTAGPRPVRRPRPRRRRAARGAGLARGGVEVGDRRGGEGRRWRGSRSCPRQRRPVELSRCHDRLAHGRARSYPLPTILAPSGFGRAGGRGPRRAYSDLY